MGKRKESRNRPKALPPRASIRFPLRIGALLSLLVIVAGGLYLLQQGPAAVEMPPMELEVEPITSQQTTLAGKITHIQPRQISQLVDIHGQPGLLALDAEQLREAIEALPWVYRARVRKVWPDRLNLWVEEQRPAVVWGEQGYLNLDGIYFDADGIVLSAMELPRIDSQQQDTVATYQQLQKLDKILSAGGQPETIQRMEVDRRGAVSLHLRSGLAIYLGRRAVEKRLRRWVAQSEVVLKRFQHQLDGVDLRYERGMVLQLKEPPNQSG